MVHWTDYLDAEGPDGAYLPWKKVEPRVGISRTTAWRLQKVGDFPKPYVVSPGRVAYRESEVEAWKASRGHRSAGAEESRNPTPGPHASRFESTAPSAAGRPAAIAPEQPQFALEASPVRAGPATRQAERPRRRPRGAHSSDSQISFDF